MFVVVVIRVCRCGDSCFLLGFVFAVVVIICCYSWFLISAFVEIYVVLFVEVRVCLVLLLL